MRNIKWFIYIVLMSIVTFFMFVYMCNLCIYKDIRKISLSDNEILKAFNIDEKKYDELINSNTKGIGNTSLHNNRLGNEKLEEIKKDINEHVVKELIHNIISYKNEENNKNNKNMHRNITYLMYCDNWLVKIIENICLRQLRIDKNIKNIVKSIYKDARYFPVAEMESNKGTYNFDNSWQVARNYGGNRKHEGTDIMYSENKEDVVPIVSISDGVIEKKGWLELGGYRLLIKANNIKYYYAHLSSYASGLEEGMRVKAGQLIGYMGSTGYGKEGTKGKFDVHLHFGMYYDNNKKEVGINPYFLLKMLKFNKLYYK